MSGGTAKGRNAFWVTAAAVLLVTILASTLAPQQVDASHFAYGSISWTRVLGTTSTFDYSMEQAWRRSAFYPTPNPGVIAEPGTSFYWLRGVYTVLPTYNEQNAAERYLYTSLTTKVVYPSDDFFTGIQTSRQQLTYSTGMYTIYWNLCCRISTLRDSNNDRVAVLFAYQDASESSSPRTSALPRFYFEKGKAAFFQVTAQSPQGYSMKFVETTQTLSGLYQIRPTGTIALSLSLTAGTITWTPSTSGLYAWQVFINDGKNQVPLDVIFQVLDACTSTLCPNPTFDPPTAPSLTYYRGVSRTNDVVAQCSDTNSIVTVTFSPLPEGATFTLKTQLGPRSTYSLQWQPTLSQNSFVVCFQATESVRGLMSLGNYCVNMVIGTASIIYVSGIARDFSKNAVTGYAPGTYGMAVTANTADGTGSATTYIASTLTATGKPTYTGTGATTIGGGATAFNWWWNTDPNGVINKEVVVSTTLSNGTNQDLRVFTFATPTFYPLDGLGFDNQGETHNRYWTYEVHTYITYNGGEIFNLQSSDDLWIFIDGKLAKAVGSTGWTLGGVHPYASPTAALSLNEQGLVLGQTYRCDIFYACRSSAHDCGLMLELPGAVLCDAIQSGTVIMPGTQAFSSGTGGIVATFGTAKISSPYLQILQTASSSSSGAAWWQDGTGVAQRMQLLHGFSMEFDFKVNGQQSSAAPEGFAVVMQAQSAVARGGESGNLGYSTLTNSLAVEFDMNTNPELSDPIDSCTGGTGAGYQHISFHTRNALPNSASETASIGKSVCPGTSKLTLTMNNDTWHRAKITFTPAKDDPSGGPQLGWLRVFMSIVNEDGSVKTTVIAPIAEAQIDGVVLQSMWPGGAPYIGFTASASDTNAALIQIRSWKMTIVPASPTTTTSIATIPDIRAGQAGVLNVQMRDACNNLIKTGGDGSGFTSSLKRAAGSSPTVIPTMTDLLTGIYSFSFAPTFTGIMAVTVSLNGLAVLGSPFQVVVNSDFTSAPKSSVIYTPQIDMARSNSPKQSAVFVVVVDPVYGDIKSSTAYSLATEESALISALSAVANGQIVAVAFAGTVGTVSSNVKAAFGVDPSFPILPGSSFCSIQEKGGSLDLTYLSLVPLDATPTMIRPSSTFPKNLTITPFNVTCYSAGSAWGNYGNIIVVPEKIRVPAGTTAKIYIQARDQYGNLNTDGSDSFTLSFSPDITLQAGSSIVAPAPAFEGHYLSSFTSTKSDQYTMYVKLNNINIGAKAAAITVNIDAGLAVASKSNAVSGTPGLSTAIAGITTYFEISLFDNYGNQVTQLSRYDVIPLPTLNHTSGAKITATSCAFSGNFYRCNYTATLAGTYGISVIVNGAAINTAAFRPVVVAGAPVRETSVAIGDGVPPSAPIAVGTTISMCIQAKDAYGNNLLVAAVSSYAFYASFSPDTNVIVLIGAGPYWQAVHDSLGCYRMKYIPKVAGTFAMSCYLGQAGVNPTSANLIGSPSQPMTISVVPGTAGPKSVITNVQTATPITAGNTYTASLLSKDQYENVRNVAPFNGSTEYVFKLSTTGGVAGRGATEVSYTGSGGVYNVKYNATKAGTYQLSVTTSVGVNIVNSPSATITVDPAATDSSRCTVFGDGFSGGVQAGQATFTIQAADKYDNFQLSSVVDTFVATITGSPSVNIVATSNGQYDVTYTVPILSSYVIVVSLAGTTIRTGTAIGYVNATLSYVEVRGVPSPAVCGQWNQFYLHNLNSQGANKTGQVGNTMRVSITNGAGYTMPLVDPITSPQGVTVDPASALIDTVVYVVRFFPFIAGDFQITVYEQGIFLSQKGSTPMAIVPGAPSTTTSKITGLPAFGIIAGTVNSYNVTVLDANNQPMETCDTQVTSKITEGVTDIVKNIVCECQEPLLPVWVCFYNVTEASYTDSQWDVLTSINGAPISGGSLQLQILPDVPSASNSITSAAGPYVAGDTVVFSVTVRDQWGNAIRDRQDGSSFAFTFSDGVTVPSAFATQFTSPDYQVSFTTTKAGTWELGMTFNGTTLGASPYLVSVGPSTVSSTYSYVSNQTDAIAGSPFSITIHTRDIYDNAWVNGYGLVTATVNTSQGYLFDAVVTDTGVDGIYTAIYPGIYTQAAGNYSWTFATREPFVPQSLRNSKSLAGPTDPKKTTFVSDNTGVVVASSRVGVDSIVTVVLRDQYNNLRTPATGEYIGVGIMVGRLQCNDVAEGGVSDPENGFPAEALANATGLFETQRVTNYDSATGQYTLTFKTYTLGIYTLNLTVGGEYLSCRKNSLLSFTTTAGLVDPTKSYYTRVPVAQAGVSYSLSVVLRDLYGNYLDSIPSSVSIQFGYFSGASMATTDGNFTGGTLPATNVMPWFASDGTSTGVAIGNTTRRYVSPAGIALADKYKIGTQDVQPITFTIMSRDAGEFVLSLAITTVDLTPNTQRITTAGTQNYWLVRPGVAASFSKITNATVGTPTAGEPGSFYLVAEDSFGNDISDPSTHQFSVIWTKEGSPYTSTATVTESTLGRHLVSYLLQWHGEFRIEVIMSSKAGVLLSADGYTGIRVLHATCAYENEATPYRCPDRTCVASYSQCTDIAVICPVASPILCASSNTCIATTSTCPCPTGLTKCADGSCAATPSKCIPTSTCPSTAPTQCLTNNIFNGQCRVSLADCPTPLVCTPGYVQCPSGTTCAHDLASCDYTSSNATTTPLSDCTLPGQYRCASGQCVTRAEDCATPKTCSTGKVLCSDGSCQTSAATCPDQYACYDPASYRCYDGSCRQSFEQCPTPVTCPPGYLLCESGSCSKTLSACTSPRECDEDQVHCPDGSCVSNIYFCPSSATCLASKPVKCSDGSCQTSVYMCPAPRECNTGYTLCGDGTCITGAQTCPTTVSCAATTPLLCPDGSCTANITLCTTPPSCPVSSPYRCPEGSCRGSLLDCPSQTTCLSSTPIRCMDGTCAVAADKCPALIECASGKVRCPGGECAYSAALCPTHVTCPLGTSKCLDGTCRASCTAAVVPTCNPGQVTCPQATAGVQCAATLNDCPQAQVCPTAKPVKCIDSTCATAATACPAAPTSYPDNRVACPDGTWASDFTLCATPTTCPAVTPYKCYDDSCRSSPADCPTAPSCSGTTPYLCPNGVCSTLPWLPTCGSAQVVCTTEAPVKCSNGQCYASLAQCPEQIQVSSCPATWTSCRDGSCVPSASSCQALTCSGALSYTCTDGLCAVDATKCNNEVTGCPWYAPERCSTGVCVANKLKNCTASPSCATGQVPCPDGSCQQNAADCALANGCKVNQRRCADKTCVSSTGSTNICIAGSSTANTCDQSAPYRCSNGFCATTSLLCPKLATNPQCNIYFPAACADGSCVASLEQCPVVKACGEGLVRCDDGSCRESGSCSTLNTCPIAGWKRCPSGLCSPTISECIDVTTGCQTGYTKCTNGACVQYTNECSTKAVVVANGCPAATPVKCWDGACTATELQCRALNGCPADAGYRCTVDNACVADPATCVTTHTTPCSATAAICADGTCPAGGATACLALNGCPVAKPVRCGDGSCATKTDACPLTVVCDIAAGEVLCYDGTCVSSYSQCAPAAVCSGTMVRCSDLTCATTLAECPTTRTCPSQSPILCPSGVCKGSLAACPSTSSTGVIGGSGSGTGSTGSTTGTGTNTNVDLTRPTCTYPSGYECFDGSCRGSLLACSKWAAQVQGLPDTAETTTICTGGSIMCASGSCVSSAKQCPVIPACPQDRPERCLDGTCQLFCTVLPTACSTGLTRCEDGICRAKCLQFDGCPLTKSYHCPNRECATAVSGCAAAIISPDADLILKRRLLQSSSSSSTGSSSTTASICTSGCVAQTKASYIEYTVDPTKSNTLAVALDSSRSVEMSLTIAAGSLVTSSSSIIFTVQPVGDNRMRDSINRITQSRRGTFGNYMTYAATLLSPAFECSVASDIIQPFQVPISVSASIDMTRYPMYADVCLAYVYYLSKVNWAGWKCVDATEDQRLANPVRDTKSNFTDASDVVSGKFHYCNTTASGNDLYSTGSIYGFVHAPARRNDVGGGDLDTFWRDNLIWIVLGICAFGAVMAGIVYAAKRLHRYREKYKSESDKVAKAQEEVDNMEQFGGQSGNKDEALEMISNPMVIQMQQMQARLDRKNAEVLSEEQAQRDKESSARQEHIGNLQSDRDKLAQELEALKAELALSASPTATAVAVDTPSATSPAATTRSGAAAKKGNTARTDFDTGRPGQQKKKKDVD